MDWKDNAKHDVVANDAKEIQNIVIRGDRPARSHGWVGIPDCTGRWPHLDWVQSGPVSRQDGGATPSRRCWCPSRREDGPWGGHLVCVGRMAHPSGRDAASLSGAASLPVWAGR